MKHNESKSDEEETKITKCDINASYAFGALPDQRLFSNGKCRPYIMDGMLLTLKALQYHTQPIF